MMKKLMRATALLILWLPAGPGLGQEQLFRTHNAVAGRPSRLAVVGSLAKDCRAGPMPEVKVLTPPRHGTLLVRSGKIKGGTRCPTTEIPAHSLVYQAREGFSGIDEVVYEVRQPDGKSLSTTIRIEVTAQAKPPARQPESTDL